MTLLLADGNNVAMRSIHAMARAGLHADGMATGPLLVYINSLTRHIREEKPNRVVVCWDSGPSAFRLALDPDYKGHRAQASPEEDAEKRSHFTVMKEFTGLAGIHQVERPGYEADDLIARYVADSPLSEPVVILSSDKDFLQLLSPRVQQVRLSAGGADTDRWTIERVRTELDCEPEHLPLAMALAGDASDGVPGVPRFGMKTAIKTLRQHDWNLNAIDHPQVVDNHDRVQTNLQLVDLRVPVGELVLPPAPGFEPTVPGTVLYESLVQFLNRYRLDSVKSRLYTGTLWKEQQ